MAKKEVIVSSPDIKNIDILYSKFKLIPGNENITMEGFRSFLSIDSVDRVTFLETHCTHSFIPMGSTVILNIEAK